jgi:hypothetical protein
MSLYSCSPHFFATPFISLVNTEKLFLKLGVAKGNTMFVRK